jgi:DNA polymerase elongation subunit (family B)
LGESITLFGRKIISFSADYTVNRVRELVPEAEVSISIGDTDGCGIAVEGVDRDTAMQAVETAAEELNDSGYDKYCAETFNIEGNHHMEIEVESYAPRLFVPADDDHDEYPQTEVGTKKRYGKWETVDEGEKVDEISITGLEAVRSDVAPITKTVQRHVLETLLRSDGPLTAKKELYPYLRAQYNSVVNGEMAIEKVAKRGGIGQDLHEYGSQSRRPQPLYRGAKYASKFCEDVHLSEGSKPMAVYVDRIHDESLPNTYRASTAEDGCVVDCIAVEDPENLPSAIDIDWNRHALKAVKEPLRTIIETMGWRWEDVLHGSEQSGFGDFQ